MLALRQRKTGKTISRLLIQGPVAQSLIKLILDLIVEILTLIYLSTGSLKEDFSQD